MNTKTIQFTAGRGPSECEWFVYKAFNYFEKKCQNSNIKVAIKEMIRGKYDNCFQSITIEIKGEQVATFIQPWLGSIQWIGNSPFRKNHKRKNWFIGCNQINTETALSLKSKDLLFQAMRSSGPGGQHANKVSSAIRVIHKPTGIMAVSSDSRSQLQNKKLAIARLQEKIEAKNRKQKEETIEQKWNNHLQLERGNASLVFKGEKFKLT